MEKGFQYVYSEFIFMIWVKHSHRLRYPVRLGKKIEKKKKQYIAWYEYFVNQQSRVIIIKSIKLKNKACFLFSSCENWGMFFVPLMRGCIALRPVAWPHKFNINESPHPFVLRCFMLKRNLHWRKSLTLNYWKCLNWSGVHIWKVEITFKCAKN